MLFFEKVFIELHKRKIKYLVVGGVAVNLYGFQRVTGDLDILLFFDKKNLKKFVAMVKFLGFLPKVPVRIEEFIEEKKRQEWIKQKHMKVFSVYNPKKDIEHVDILIEKQIDFNRAYKNRKVIKAGSINISVIPIDDLIRLKRKAGRERDIIDIRALMKIKELEDEKKTKR